MNSEQQEDSLMPIDFSIQWGGDGCAVAGDKDAFDQTKKQRIGVTPQLITGFDINPIHFICAS